MDIDQDIEFLIAEGKIQSAIYKLLENSRNKRKNKFLMLLNSRLEKITHDQLLGLIDYNVYLAHHTRITSLLIDFIRRDEYNLETTETDDIEFVENFFKNHNILIKIVNFLIFLFLYFVFASRTWHDFGSFTKLALPFFSLALIIGIYISTFPNRPNIINSFHLTFFIPFAAFIIVLFTYKPGGLSCGYVPPDATDIETFIIVINLFISSFLSFLFGFISSMGTFIGQLIIEFINRLYHSKLIEGEVKDIDIYYTSINKNMGAMRSITIGGLVIWIFTILSLVISLKNI